MNALHPDTALMIGRFVVTARKRGRLTQKEVASSNPSDRG